MIEITDVFIIAAGLINGSFLYTMATRLQDNDSVWRRSSCDHCSKVINPIALVPVLGFLIYRGKSSCCKNKISVNYPIIEILNAVLTFIIYLKLGWSLAFFHFFLIFEVLLLISIIDFRSYLIFPQPIIAGLIIQSLWLVFYGRIEIINSLIGLFAGAGVFHWIAYLYQIIRKREGLGDGDATLLGLIGFCFGWHILFSTIFWGATFGIIGGGLLLVLKKHSLKKEIAFGPWLVLATFLSWYYPTFFQNFPLGLMSKSFVLF